MSSGNQEEIEVLPDEIGEETILDMNIDNGTVYSKIAASVDHGEQPEKNDEPEERDFDKNPTILYALVQKKIWNEAAERAMTNPEEAGIWVSRREKDGRVRWRLLPLHAAIVFKAPEDVIKSLLNAYPKGAETRDDQGMLPLHLAFRNAATEAVVKLLLLAYPYSVEVPDRKGRLPLTLAQAAPEPHRDVFIKALEKGPSHYAMAATEATREKIVAEQEAIFEARLAQTRQFHDYEVSELKAEFEKKEQEALDKIAELESELAKTNETSQVLVDHVNGLEAQLASRSDTERFLATKIANLSEKLKETEKLKEDMESSLGNDKNALVEERDNLTAKVADLQAKVEIAQEKHDRTLELLGKKEAEWTHLETELRKKLNQTEVEWANSQANGAILEAQLKKRMGNEHLLASQVSSLASRLAEIANDAKENTKKYEALIKELEEERSGLRKTVADLTARLKKAAEVMESTNEQQIKIIDEAISQEEMISNALVENAKIVNETIHLAKELERAKEEQEIMRTMLEKKDEAYELAKAKRDEIRQAITAQGKELGNTKGVRETIISCVEQMGTKMNGTLQEVLQGIEIGTKQLGEEGDDEEDDEKSLKSHKSHKSHQRPPVDAAVSTTYAADHQSQTQSMDATISSHPERIAIAEVSLADAGSQDGSQEVTMTSEEPPKTVVKEVISEINVDEIISGILVKGAEVGPEEIKVVPKKLEDIMKEISENAKIETVSPETEARTDDVACLRSSDTDRVLESRET
eukprot:CAMPEP_0178744468 /NCGR_PEP_ID=MMETSP0744-20121128/6788_1 /TAXON_ID=913974 /ORGANISM="Nitzschia punctata, Strain CCMP561" /LENGTH=753 /DNA_ID=CAMNT_0020397607 /DNA_START=81 /DNA_END=2342 /DNA_ORIENTATION=+